jgi:hypothetical protein
MLQVVCKHKKKYRVYTWTGSDVCRNEAWSYLTSTTSTEHICTQLQDK